MKLRWQVISLAALLIHAPVSRADSCAMAAKELYEIVREDVGNELAERRLRALLVDCPELAQGHFYLGISLLSQEKATESVRSLEKSLDLKKDVATYVALGNALVKLDRLADAESAYQDAIKLDPGSYKALLGLGIVALQQKRYAQAEDNFRKAIQINSDDALGFYNLGLLLESQGRLEEARESFRAAGERRSPYSDAQLHLGAIQLAEQNADGAEATFRAIALHQPKNPDVWIGIAQAAELRKDYTSALSNLDKALALDPNNVRAKINKAVVQIKNGDAEKGNVALTELAAANKQNSAAQSALGWSLIQQKRYDDAEKVLEAAISLNANDYFALNNLGVLFEAKGESEKAKVAFARARELRPRLQPASRNLGALEY